MRIYFVGIGGAGIGPLALMAKEAGYDVLGSDSKDSQYVHYLRSKRIDISLNQDGNFISEKNKERAIDWVVGVSAIVRDRPNQPELKYARENSIKISERDELLNQIISENNLELIAAAGTHGKTTTTAMIIWLFKCLGVPASYSVGAKLSFADMSKYDSNSKCFIYECDEFHKNFLKFSPEIAAITGIAWDHHEVFPTENDYNESFVKFLNQSKSAVIFNEDFKKLKLLENKKYTVLSKGEKEIKEIDLIGKYFREDAWLAVHAVHKYLGEPINKLLGFINQYPGSNRRMEKIAENLYSDYAHTPEKILGCLDAAKEILSGDQKLVVVYEPLTNRRQHYIMHQYRDLFDGVDELYWVPSYKAREDETQRFIEPREFTESLKSSQKAHPASLDGKLWSSIQKHQINGDLIVIISGGGGESLDEWVRKRLHP